MSVSPLLIDDLTARLRTQRLVLATELRHRLHSGDDAQEMALPNHFGHQDDAAEASQLNDIEVAQLGREMSELQAIDQALHRIATGTYGQCARCGEAIAEERLQAQPHAHLCLPCQKASEQRAPGARRPAA